MTDQATLTPVELLPPGEAVHGNERWMELRRTGVTASEIAVVMGLSKWDSPFNLYWSKVNGWTGEDNEIARAGRHLEASIANWWWFDAAADRRRGAMLHAGLYAHPDRPWQLATPDRLLHASASSSPYYGPIKSLLECKWVAYSWDGWGEPGTDEVPVAYRCQALWQLDVMGVDEVHIAALGPGGFRPYLVRRDENDLALMRKAGEEFVNRVAAGDPPPLDSHTATIGALKRLYPEVGDGELECTPEVAVEYAEARAARKAADEQLAECEAWIRQRLGSTYSRLVHNGKTVASRSVFETSRIDSKRLRAEQPDIAAAYTTTTTVDKLTPGKAKS